MSGTLAARRANTVRTGEGKDSHNAVTRFFDLPSAIAIDERLPDTAFTQYGGHLKAHWAITPTAQLVASYLRGQQDGGKRYDQLLGGDGNLVADLRNLMADHFYTRFEKSQAGFLSRFTLSYSFTAQREERVNQGGNGNPRAAINHEPERTRVHGLQTGLQKLAGRHDLTLGGDAFFEAMRAPSFATSALTSATTVRRGRVPDGSSYRQGGVFLQDVFEAAPGRLRLNAAVRYSMASYEAKAADSPPGAPPLWPDDSYDTSAFTFRAGALLTLGSGFSLAGNVSRGFRAPDITDLGTFGLTGSGYEVSNREVEGLGGTVGNTADASALDTGDAVRVLDPETSLNYELTLRYKSRRFKADLTAFQNDIDGNIAKQSLILPQGALGLSLAGEPITRQLPNGVVFVGASTNPVLVRTNFDEARIRGIEATVRRPDPFRRGSWAGSSPTSMPRTSGRAHLPISRVGPPLPTAGSRSASRRTTHDGSGWNPIFMRPWNRTTSRAWTWATAGPGPAVRVPASRASSRTARGRGASWERDPTASPATPTMSCSPPARPWPRSRLASSVPPEPRRRSSPRSLPTSCSGCGGPSVSPSTMRCSSIWRTSVT